MTALPARRRRRTLAMLGATFLVVLVAGSLGMVGAVAIRDYTAATDVGSVLPVQYLPTTPVGLFATVDTSDRLTSTTVLVLAPSGQFGGSIVSLPVNADITSGAGDERVSLQEAYARGGPEALVAGVESALSITLDHSLVADPGEAGGVLLAVGPIEVDLPTDVRVTEDDGRTTVVFDAGPQTLTTAQAVRVLTGHAEDETEAQRRPNLEAVWAGVSTAIGAGIEGLGPSSTIVDFVDLVTSMYSGPAGSRGLTTVPVLDAQNPTEIDVEQIDNAEAALVFASIAPASVSAAGPWLSFRIEAPPGYDEKVLRTIRLLLFFGGNVISVDLAAPRQSTTEMIVYSEETREQVSTTNEIFGDITAIEPTTRIEGIDVTIRLGTDFLDNPELPGTPTAPDTAPVAPEDTVPDTAPDTTG